VRPYAARVEPQVVLLVAGLTILVLLVALLASRWSERQRFSRPEPAVRELPEGVSEVLTALRSAALVLDVSDAVVKATPAAYAVGLVRGRHLAHPELVEMVRAVRREGLILERELELPRGPLGRGTLVVLARVAPLGPLHVLMLVEDRTEARRIDEVRRDFVVNVSHELKTPVGAISLLAETMTAAADDPEAVRRFASRMQRESDRLAALVQEIIDLSRLQVSQALAAPVIVRVDDVLAEAVDRARMAAEAKDIGLDRGGLRGAQVYGDHDLLVTAVRNLVDNGVRYSERGTRIGIGVREEAGLVEIAVADQGIGIPGPEQDRVFERFYRVDPARSRLTGGTGLGLSIVKHVAANHGGDVTVWSEPHSGSTFTLRLPAALHGAGTASLATPDGSVAAADPQAPAGPLPTSRRAAT